MPRPKAQKTVKIQCRVPEDIAIRFNLAAAIRNCGKHQLMSELIEKQTPPIPAEYAKVRAVPQSV